MVCNTPPGQCYAATGSCSAGSCSYAFTTAACNDGDGCTVGDTCDGAGNCVGSPKVCNTPPNSCFKTAGATCSGGNCTYPANTGATCDDANPCTSGETCDGSGMCNGGTLKTCNTPPNTVCYDTIGACQVSNGSCLYNPKSAATGCTDDNNPCTDDFCNGSGTCAHTPVNGRTCNTDCVQNGTCDSSGNCIGTPVANNTPCTGNGCTGVCESGACSCSPPDMSGEDMTMAAQDLSLADLSLADLTSSKPEDLSGAVMPDLTPPPSSGADMTTPGGTPASCGCVVGGVDRTPGWGIFALCIVFAVVLGRRRLRA
jgi:hypothetical protein